MIKIQPAIAQQATQIAPLIYDAIGTIAHHLTNETEDSKVLDGLAKLVEREDNRHSYKNTFVAVENDTVLGIVVLYDGKRGKELDTLLSEKLSYYIEPEAHDDEYYIDTICVSEQARGKGIGTLLLQFSGDQARKLGFNKLSLNVELEKLKARKLYEREGFIITEGWTINGDPFHHMVKLV